MSADPGNPARRSGAAAGTHGAASRGAPGGATASEPAGMRTLRGSLGIVLILVLGFADYLTGPDIRFYILYWFPIAALAWFCGGRWAGMAVAASTAATAAANGPQWAAQPHVLWWNMGTSLASFAFLAYLITTLRRLVARERDTARTDFLTTLANGRALDEALAAELARSRRSGAPLSLTYVDIDDFKLVNDRLGHAVGDGVLKEVARRLRTGLRELDLVARLGGDEFVVLFPETGSAEVRVVVGRLRRRVADPVPGVSWQVSASIGTVTCPDGARSPDELIRRADDLMYEAKQAGKNAARFAVLPAGTRPAD